MLRFIKKYDTLEFRTAVEYNYVTCDVTTGCLSRKQEIKEPIIKPLLVEKMPLVETRNDAMQTKNSAALSSICNENRIVIMYNVRFLIVPAGMLLANRKLNFCLSINEC